MNILWFVVAAFLIAWGTSLRPAGRQLAVSNTSMLVLDALSVVLIAVGLAVAVNLAG